MKDKISRIKIDAPEAGVVLDFDIVHNMQVHGNINTLSAAFTFWVNTTEEQTPKSFVDYINSKAYISEFAAKTIEEYGDVSKLERDDL